jgi:uncharacterized OB-fold protein
MTTLMDRLRTFCAPEYAVVRAGLDPVNPAMIRHWCEAMGDRNPRYAGGKEAPPQMLGAWVMRPIEWPEPDPRDGRRALMAALDEAGFTSVVATNSEQEYMRALKPGDRITVEISVEEVGDEKQTALGPGHFFTTRSVYRDQESEVVGVERFRMLKFKPKARAGTRPHPAMNQDTAFFWEGLRDSKLLIQRCASCKTLRHPPRAACADCGSLDWDTVESAGRGEVYSFTVHHHPPIPGFEMPYVVGLIALDEGVRMLANVTGDPAGVAIGARVVASYTRFDDELTLPMFAREP